MMTWAPTTTLILHPTKEGTMISILLVDDVPTVLDGLRLRLGLEEDLDVVGEALDGESALALAQELKPDVVVMDVGMPRMDGIAAIERLQEVLPGVRVAVLSIHDDADTRERAFQAGASAYVEKRVVSNRLVKAIRAAVLGAASTT
jgi:DNA-binding NarL/FixJ family response regulator